MALAEPILRQFGMQRLQNLRFRGAGLLGTAIGTAVGIGYGLAKDYEFSVPWSPSFQPKRRQPPGVYVNGEISSNKQVSYQYGKTSYRRNTVQRSRNINKRNNRCRCCTSCRPC